MNIVIGCLYILFSLYLLWLLIFVFHFNLSEFFTWKKKTLPVKKETNVVVENTEIVGKTQARFIEKMPELEPVKPYLQVPLAVREKEEPEIMPDEEIRKDYLTAEEQKAIREEIDEGIWGDDFSEPDFRQPGSVRDMIHASKVVTGEISSEADFEQAKETVRHIPDEVVELFARHAINEKRIKDMLAERLDEINIRKREDAKNFRKAVQEFMVEDYIA